MQSTQFLHHQYTFPLGAQYTTRHLDISSSSSLSKITLAEPRPKKVAECSIAWQARIAAWNSALSHSTRVFVGDAKTPRTMTADGPALTSLTPTASELALSTGLSTDNESIPTSNKPASFAHRPVNLKGSTFPDRPNNAKGNAETLPSFENGTPAVVTLANALELIREVDSDATLIRAVRAVIHVLSREQVEHRRRVIEASFRKEVLGLVQKSFSEMSSLRFLSDQDFTAWLVGEPSSAYDPRRERDSAKALAICTLLCGLIKIKAMPSSDLELVIQLLCANRRIQGHKAIIYHLLKVGSQFTYPISTITNLVKIGVSMSVDDRISRDIVQLIIQYKLNNVSG